MTSITRAAAGPRPAPRLNWRLAAGLTGAAGGAVIVAGAFLPWVYAFAGLIGYAGVSGSNGRIMAGAGALVAVAGLYHAVRGGTWSRWLLGVGGFAALGFSGYLLVQLAATTRALGGSSMVLARGGPGLWVTAAGSLVAFATLFLPGQETAASPAGGTVVRARAARLWQQITDRTADMESRGPRRALQIALGLVWLLDGALQLQPYMFGRPFVSHILMPAVMGSPSAVSSPAMWADRLIGHDVAAWNAAFAVTQLLIALGLLWRPVVKAALAGSVAWALSVWWLGEGLGGLLTGSASPVTGAPGAVILYALIAVLAWPRRSVAGSVAGPLASRWARAAWVLLWGGLAYLIVQPAIRAPGYLHDALTASAAGEPGWLAGLDRSAGAAAGSHGLAISAALAAVFVLIAAGVLVPATARPALLAAAVAGLAIWVVGENFGAIATGTSTDPNSGLLLVLLAAAYWPRRAAGDRAALPAT